MTADLRKRAEELFQIAVDLPVGERADRLDIECGGNARLRDAVERLLRTYESELGDFLLDPLEAPTELTDALPPPEPTDRTDWRLGHYEVKREIGRGGMGMVYLAVDTALARNAAIKLLPDECAHDERRLAMFEREARTAANLNHPNIATIYEFGEVDQSFFIAMEYVEGRPLSDLLRESQPLPLSDILDIGVQIAEGLAAAHESNIVHRDLKPGNLVITDEARVKILDFGLAKALRAEPANDADDARAFGIGANTSGFGTVGYSSPEQCAGHPVDLRSDLFSFGVVLYELATGVAPFRRHTVSDTITAVLEESPADPSTMNAELPPALTGIIEKLLAKHPEDRYQSSADVLADLQKLKHAIESTHHRRRVQALRAQRRDLRHSRRRLIGTIATALAVLLLTIGTALWLNQREIAAKHVISLYQELMSVLPDWRFEEAEQLVVEIAKLDPAKGEQARSEVKRFRKMRDDIVQSGPDDMFPKPLPESTTPDAPDPSTEAAEEAAELAREFANDIESGRLHSALDRFRQLEGLEPIRPDVRERALALRKDLIDAVLGRAAGQLDFDASDVPGARETLELLRQVDPQNERADVLEKRADLEELKSTAHREMTAGALNEILQAMESIDSTSPRTEVVREWFTEREDQERAFDGACEDFRYRRMSGLEEAIGEYEDIDLPSMLAKNELDELYAAQRWLSEFQDALDEIETDYGNAVDRGRALDPPDVSQRFQEAALANLKYLSEKLDEKRASIERRAGAIQDSILELCDERRLPEAKDSLEQLEGLAELIGLDIDTAIARVESLKASLEPEIAYEQFRRRVRDLEAKPDDLIALEEGWKSEVERITQLLVVESAELRRRRAVLYLRLGAYAEALSDAENLPRTSDGLYLHALATFALAPRDPTKIKVALVFLKDTESARGLYLKAALMDILAGLPEGDAGRRAEARRLLEQAIHQGFESADAYHRLATLSWGAPATVVELAGKALAAPLTEGEMIVRLGGHENAITAAHRFRHDLYIRRAQGHWEADDYESCIDDCRSAIELDDEVALSYFLLGAAEGEAGLYASAIGHLDRFLELDPDRSEFVKKASTLRTLYRSILDSRP